MKIPFLNICAAVFSLGTVFSVQAQDTIREEMEKRQTEVRLKLDDLFAHRDNPIPEMDNALNPFYRDGSTVTMPEPTEEAAPRVIVPPSRKDSELLADIAQSLVINGIVSFNGRQLIVINQAPTPAGRMISVDYEGTTRFVRVEEIHSNRVVLSFGSAIMALPITGNKKSEDEGGDEPAPESSNPGF